jgi:RHH-type proline utilization regulon transcriptional repressor/proline dehydrogenase/delta 1-pyrroline-5-carboxylate dehydrogenase
MSLEPLIEAARDRIANSRAGKLSGAPLREASIELAGNLLSLSKAYNTNVEAQRDTELARLMDDRVGQLFSTLLTDRVPRLTRSQDIVHQAVQVIERLGPPQSLSPIDRSLLRAVKPLRSLVPGILSRAIRKRIIDEARPYLIPGEDHRIADAVEALKGPGIRVNVNQLGEEVLGHGEAESHMQSYLGLLANPAIDTISVKISSICAQLNTLALDASLERISVSLRRIYRAAIQHGRDTPKLVMLDMEAYRDLELTHRAFTQVLGEPEFQDLRAGIVLQAYLPDSHAVHESLIIWAQKRVEEGGAPIQMRLVKGANLAVERVESSHTGWALPIYESKAHVDASFKSMVERALHPSTVSAIRVGIASHNLFDVAFALTLCANRDLTDGVHFEVLSGMAGGLSRALLSLNQEVLVYTPAVAQAHLHSAIAYLVRRLDENTADENFLRHSFAMQLDDHAWVGQRTAFAKSFELMHSLDTSPKRSPRSYTRPMNLRFENEPDTDFTLPRERQRVTEALASLRAAKPRHLPLYIGQESIHRPPTHGYDPSLPHTVPYQLSLATPEDISNAIDTGVQAETAWSATPLNERCRILRAAAQAIRESRAELTAIMVMDGGKAVTEADAEISEAVDFAEYYAQSADELFSRENLSVIPRGLTLITPPWNFPLAIPLGGAFAALATGNPVILKPAQETAAIATFGVELCHAAGVPREALQLLVAEDEVATALIEDPRVQTVVLTGGTSTARLFRRLRPRLHLLAETGGKNATIVSRFADIDLAIDSTVHSAFAHAGQKCSATSLLILPRELAMNPRFRRQLVDAAESLKVSSSWDLEAKVTPLVHEPSGVLLRALTTLEAGEEWWLEPRVHPDNPRLWSPGIKFGVKPGSFAHLTEFFGPVLSVLVSDDLDHAISLANQTPYGLTAGFHSLDEKEVSSFIARMNAGNLYINRTTTGAIVRRQPFGGRKDSCFGPGAKAGGPNYVALFTRLEDANTPLAQRISLPPRTERLLSGIGRTFPSLLTSLRQDAQRFEAEAQEHFRIVHDPSQLRGQENRFRYQARPRMLIIAFPGTTPSQLCRAGIVAVTAGVPFRILITNDSVDAALCAHAFGPHRILTGDWREAVATGKYDRLRALGEVPDDVFSHSGTHVSYIDDSPVLASPRAELLKVYLEQSVCIDYHRYGHLGMRELDA